MELSFSLFHEPWWLSAVTGGRYEEAVVKNGTQLAGRFPFVTARRSGFRISLMPPFTHVLGPIVAPGVGKPQTRLMRRLSITRDLIDQLPSFDFFKQVFDPSVAGNLAIADGLAFQDRGFRISPQYTFQIDAQRNPDEIWNGMNFKVRQHIRRAEARYSVSPLDDPDRFAHFYVQNLKKAKLRNRTNFRQFSLLFSECQTRQCGQILGAWDLSGEPAAMTFLVWGHGVLYYLLSTRAPDLNDNGAISLLIWSAIKHARTLGLKFDFDGVYTSGSARFMSAFGGQIAVRLITIRTAPMYRGLQLIKQRFVPNESEAFA